METAAGRPREAQRLQSLQSEPPKQSKAKPEAAECALRELRGGAEGPRLHRPAAPLRPHTQRQERTLRGWTDGQMDGRMDGCIPCPGDGTESFSLISACSVAAAAATRPAFRCRCATPASPNGHRGLNRITLMSRERKGRCAGGAVGSRTPRSTQAGMAPSAPLRTHASPSAPNCT